MRALLRQDPNIIMIGEIRDAETAEYAVRAALADGILLLVPAGYFFANFEFVKKNFSAVILAIIVFSILPGVIEFLRERSRIKREKANGAK